MRRTPIALVITCFFLAFLSDIVDAQDVSKLQEMMRGARRMAEQEQETAYSIPGGDVIVFYNNPRPLCYTYMIPGEWFAAREERAWRSKDGRQFAGVLFMRSQDLKRFKGETLVERAGGSLTQGYEKDWKRSLTGIKLARFESALPETWKWTADPVVQGDHQIRIPTKIIADFSPDAVAVLTIGGTADDDGLALRILSTMRTTKEPPCYFPALEASLKALLTPSPQAEPSGPSSSETAATAHTYTNPTYQWTIAYPTDWKLDAADSGSVRVSSGDGLCGFHSGAAALKSAEEFADLAEEQDQKEHLTTHHSPKQRISLPNGVVGMDVLREIRGGGRSRRVYMLADGIAYNIDCETYASKWEQFAPSADRIIGSFTLQKK